MVASALSRACRKGLVVLGLGLCTALPVHAAPVRLSLAEATARAQANPVARAAILNQRAVEAQAAEARGARYPRFNLTAFIAPSPDISCDNADCTRTSPSTAIAPEFDGMFGSVRIEVLQPLYTFGKLDAAVEAGAHAAQLTSAQADGVIGDMAVETAKAYFGVGLARQLAGMLQEGSDQIQKGMQTLNDRLASGDPDVTVQDRLRLTTFQSEVTLRLSEARERELTALEGLRGLVGEREADIAESAFIAVERALGDVDTHLKAAHTGSPELRMASHGVSALEQRTRLEKARWWPDLGIAGAFQFARAQGVDEPPSAFANNPFNITRAEIGAVMRWQVEPAMQAARVSRAEAEQARASSLRDAALRLVEFNVRDAHNRASQAKVRLEAAQQGEKSARGWVASVMQADAVGTASARDLADAYLAYFTLHSRVLQSTYEWNVALAALERATGELSRLAKRP
jgi:outer membrane protein TolC